MFSVPEPDLAINFKFEARLRIFSSSVNRDLITIPYAFLISCNNPLRSIDVASTQSKPLSSNLCFRIL